MGCDKRAGEANAEAHGDCAVLVMVWQRLATRYNLQRQEASSVGCAHGEACTRGCGTSWCQEQQGSLDGRA